MNAKLLLPILFLSATAAHAGTVSVAPAPAPAAAASAARPAAVHAPAPALSEAQKIDALIGSVEHLSGAVFIRNGTEYDGHKAAAHLRRKLGAAGKRVGTAEQFIDYLATGSSMTGKPYKIRFADGRTVESATYFRAELRRLEAGHRSAKG
jgi:hypothetical protein